MSDKKLQAAQAITKVLRNFVSPHQLLAIGDLCRGEERHFFLDKIIEMTDLIQKMPKTYEQDGKGDEAVAFLHYFAPGYDCWITEKDMGEGDSLPEHGEQHQAFGLAWVHGGHPELGYISISELIQNGVELDLHFEPKKISEIKAEFERRYGPSVD